MLSLIAFRCSVCRLIRRWAAQALGLIPPRQYEHCPDAIKLAQGPLSTTTFVQFGDVDRSRASNYAHRRRDPARFACRCCVASLAWRTGGSYVSRSKPNEISPKPRRPTKEVVSRRKLRSVREAVWRVGYGDLRRVEEVTNKHHRISRTFFHQPMPRARDDSLLNIGCHVAHDFRLQRTK